MKTQSGNSKDLFQFPYYDEISKLYRNKCNSQLSEMGLGGVLDNFPTEIGVWDATFSEGFHIELDEEQHFNRYRNITLRSAVYQNEELLSPEQLD